MNPAITNIIIDTDERFIGRYKNHRISIILVYKANEITFHTFDITISNPKYELILETSKMFESMNEAINYCLDYIETNLK